MATAVVGLSMVGLLNAMGSGDRVNAYGRDLTTAAFLMGEMREYCINLPFRDLTTPGSIGLESGESSPDDIDDLMDRSFTPPVDGSGTALSDFGSWSQVVDVDWVNDNDFTDVVADDASNVVRVTVTINHGTQTISTASWLQFGEDQS